MWGRSRSRRRGWAPGARVSAGVVGLSFIPEGGEREGVHASPRARGCGRARHPTSRQSSAALFPTRRRRGLEEASAAGDAAAAYTLGRMHEDPSVRPHAFNAAPRARRRMVRRLPPIARRRRRAAAAGRRARRRRRRRRERERARHVHRAVVPRRREQRAREPPRRPGAGRPGASRRGKGMRASSGARASAARYAGASAVDNRVACQRPAQPKRLLEVVAQLVRRRRVEAVALVPEARRRPPTRPSRSRGRPPHAGPRRSACRRTRTRSTIVWDARRASKGLFVSQ